MKKVISLVMIVSLMLTVVLSAAPLTTPTSSTPIPDQIALSIEGAGWLGGCGMSGMWAVGAILLGAGPVGWFALGISAGLLMTCAWL